MDYKQTASQILNAVGGEKNVAHVVHCATRLRFNLADDKKADTNSIEKIAGVKGTMFQGGQFQVIIGNDVTSVYDEVIKLTGGEGSGKNEKAVEKKGNIGTRLVSTLTEIFAPALPAITGAGMFKALLAAVVAFNLMDTGGNTYRILYSMSDAAFYFLPMLIGYTAAKKFGGNPTLVLTMAGLLLYPDFAALLGEEAQTVFFGIPVTSFTYSASVIPIILIALLESKVEKWAYKYVPSAIRYFIAPLVVLVICGTAGILVLGPIGGWAGDIIAIGLQWFVDHALIGGCLLIGILGPIIGMTGIHQSFTPITISMFTQFGFDPLMFPATLACNMAECGVALAAGLRAKDKNKKSMLLSSSFTALMGITEPALFGCTIKSKKNMITAMAGGGIGAVVAGILSLKAFAISGPGLASITMFLGGDEPVRNIVSAGIVMIATIAVTFIIGWFVMDKDEGSQEENKTLDKIENKILNGKSEFEIKAPIKGKVIPLEDVPDETFASGCLGKGVAIIPEEGTIVSPVDGEISNVFDTKHAIGIQGVNGEEMLIHIGLETVSLKGGPFHIQVQSGDPVKAGDVIGYFDIQRIKEAGLQTVTPVLLVNTDEFEKIDFFTGMNAECGSTVMHIYKK